MAESYLENDFLLLLLPEGFAQDGVVGLLQALRLLVESCSEPQLPSVNLSVINVGVTVPASVQESLAFFKPSPEWRIRVIIIPIQILP